MLTPVLERMAAWVGASIGRALDPAAVVASRPRGGGWSNDTTILTTGLDEPARVVVRVAPSGPTMFPGHDIRREHDCLAALAADGSVPVPALLAADLAGEVLGRAAFVMAFVDGRIPSDDRPSFAEAGWLAEAEPADQRRFDEGLVAAMAAVHVVVAPPALAATLVRSGDSTCLAELDHLHDIWEFDRGPVWPRPIDRAFADIREWAPASSHDVFLWGDARPANVIVALDGFDPLALLDWELASIGPPELDVMWLVEMNRMRTTGAGIAPPAGFLDDDERIACYERVADRPLDTDLLAWARAYSALRIAVLMHRHLRVMVHLGRLPDDHRLLRDTVAITRLAGVLRPQAL